MQRLDVRLVGYLTGYSANLGCRISGRHRISEQKSVRLTNILLGRISLSDIVHTGRFKHLN